MDSATVTITRQNTARRYSGGCGNTTNGATLHAHHKPQFPLSNKAALARIESESTLRVGVNSDLLIDPGQAKRGSQPRRIIIERQNGIMEIDHSRNHAQTKATTRCRTACLESVKPLRNLINGLRRDPGPIIGDGNDGAVPARSQLHIDT